MPKIKCGSLDCIWNSDQCFCTFGSDQEILLMQDCLVLVNKEVQHYHKCKAYEKSKNSPMILTKSTDEQETQDHDQNDY